MPADASEFTCAACGYPHLNEPPRSESGGGSYEICPSCGFQYGVTDDDLGITYAEWRRRWVERGMPWDSVGLEPPPTDWNPQGQLHALLQSINPTWDAFAPRHPVQQQINDLLESIGDRLSVDKRDDVIDLTRHYEWNVGIDVLADALHDQQVVLTYAEQASLRTIIASLSNPLAEYSFLGLD